MCDGQPAKWSRRMMEAAVFHTSLMYLIPAHHFHDQTPGINAASCAEFGGTVDAATLLEFVDDGGNLLVVLDSGASDQVHLPLQCGHMRAHPQVAMSCHLQMRRPCNLPALVDAVYRAQPRRLMTYYSSPLRVTHHASTCRFGNLRRSWVWMWSRRAPR